jgi:hypothetical protein
MTLTPEQIEQAHTIPLEELRALAIKEAEGVVEQPTVNGSSEPAPKQARNEKGQFIADADALDNSADDAAEEEEETTPSRTIYRKEIDNADGSGVDVYEADSLEELVDKIAEGKRNANKKIRELNQRVKVEDTRTEQQKADDDYVVAQRLQKEPKKTVKEIVAEVISEREAAAQRSTDAQARFVATHPDFIPGESNGKRMVSWLKTQGHSEITYDGLEKAYQDLKSSGLLELKSEEANGATDTEVEATERTVQSPAEVTQQPSRKKASTISTRARTNAPVKTQPSEDEAYAMPLEQLRELANKQLSRNPS